jgi:hypothetical protein
MKLSIPRLVERLELRGYAEGFGEEGLWVWVNPPRDMIRVHDEQVLTRKASDEEIFGWYAEVWSQGPEGTHWSVEEVRELWESSRDTDPRLWAWLVARTSELIREHRVKKKVSSS